MAVKYLTESGLGFQYIVDDEKSFYTASVYQGYDVSSSPFSNSIIFDGSDTYIAITDQSINISPSLTILAWIKTETNAEQRICGNKGADSATTGYDFYLDVDKLSLRYGDGTERNTYVDYEYDDNIWHLIGVTFNAGTVKFYADGVQVGSTSTPGGTTISDTTNVFTIGAKPGLIYKFTGSMDNVYVFDSVLSVDNINSIYTGESISISPKSLWKFDEGSGTVAKDSSGNGLNGVITSGTYSSGPTQLVKTIFPGGDITSDDALY